MKRIILVIFILFSACVAVHAQGRLRRVPSYTFGYRQGVGWQRQGPYYVAIPRRRSGLARWFRSRPLHRSIYRLPSRHRR